MAEDQQLHDRIRMRAYELWEGEGWREGGAPAARKGKRTDKG